MGTVALRLTGAELTLGQGEHAHRVFDGLDLEVRRGELLTILGPSGSGKSTLLSVLAGLRRLDAGTLEVAPNDDGSGRRPAVVFQDPLLLPWLNVLDNVALGLSYRCHRPRRSRHARRRVAADMLGRLGISDLAARLPGELSGGQAQRVAVARAVATGPSVLLLDEPFGALDPRTRRELQDWLAETRTAMSLTVVLVTHDLDEALLLGDRVGVLGGAGDDLHLTSSDVSDRSGLAGTVTRGDLLERLGVDAPRCSAVDA